jgi:hypothetical protein
MTPPNKDEARKLVRHWPITVDLYDSGQIGFVARPMKKGRRFSKNFSTSVYPTLEEAAAAAIAYCKEIDQVHPDPIVLNERIAKLVQEAISHGLDPEETFRNGITIGIHNKLIKGAK